MTKELHSVRDKPRGNELDSQEMSKGVNQLGALGGLDLEGEDPPSSSQPLDFPTDTRYLPFGFPLIKGRLIRHCGLDGLGSDSRRCRIASHLGTAIPRLQQPPHALGADGRKLLDDAPE